MRKKESKLERPPCLRRFERLRSADVLFVPQTSISRARGAALVLLSFPKAWFFIGERERAMFEHYDIVLSFPQPTSQHIGFSKAKSRDVSTMCRTRKKRLSFSSRLSNIKPTFSQVRTGLVRVSQGCFAVDSAPATYVSTGLNP